MKLQKNQKRIRKETKFQAQRTYSKHLNFSAKEKERIFNAIQSDPSYIPTFEEALAAFSENTENRMSEYMSGNSPTTLLNKDYLEKVGQYLKERIHTLRTNGEKVKILEIGAGNGALSKAINDKLLELGLSEGDYELVAIDLNPDKKSIYDVKKTDYIEALHDHEPQIAISCWMPRGIDFSKEIRNTDSIEEYIVIGESDVTGVPWDTWGYRFNERSSSEQPPYEQEGFLKEYLGEADMFQLSKSDIKDKIWTGPDDKGIGVTASFKRV